MPTLTVRLSQAEMEVLGRCCKSRVIGDITASEFVRLMIRREGKRRFALELPDYKGEARTGRPRKNVL